MRLVVCEWLLVVNWLLEILVSGWVVIEIMMFRG